MKKILGAVLLAALTVSSLAAYTPMPGGQNVLRLTEPQLLTGANSAAGGALFGVTPASIVNNPALTAWEQRNILDVAATAFVSGNSEENDKVGSAYQAGLLIPSRWCVSTLLLQGIWANFYDMPVGDSINVSAATSKDITDEVSVGTMLHFGYLFNGYASDDWSLDLGIGAYYNFGDWKFMKDIRFGASILNIGKNYAKLDEVNAWPGLSTLRTGAAATFLKTDVLELGLSLDLSYPAFQDFVVDAGLQMQFWKFLKISSAWEYDAREFSNEAKNILPSFGVSFKFGFNSKDNAFMKKHGWQESEITVSAAYRQLYENINAVSAGAVMELGLADTKAPEIKLWGEN